MLLVIVFNEFYDHPGHTLRSIVLTILSKPGTKSSKKENEFNYNLFIFNK